MRMFERLVAIDHLGDIRSASELDADNRPQARMARMVPRTRNGRRGHGKPQEMDAFGIGQRHGEQRRLRQGVGRTPAHLRQSSCEPFGRFGDERRPRRFIEPGPTFETPLLAEQARGPITCHEGRLHHHDAVAASGVHEKRPLAAQLRPISHRKRTRRQGACERGIFLIVWSKVGAMVQRLS